MHRNSIFPISFWQFLYLFAKKMPKSHAKFSLGAAKVRYYIACRIVSSIGTNVNIERGASFHKNIQIGDGSGIGEDAIISEGVVIGNGVLMGGWCHIFTQNHVTLRTDIPIGQQGMSEIKPVIISDDVWICDRVTICPGCIIGKGAVIAAGAVVTKNVPEFAVVAGVPAKVVKYRR